MKRVLSLLLASMLFITSASFAGPIKVSASVYTYDADAAIAFAATHCATDAKNHTATSGTNACDKGWLCAEFVAECLVAGGFPKKLSAVAGLGGFAGQITEYGNKITCNKTGGGAVKMSNFETTLSKGDPIVILYGYGTGSGNGHVVIYSGETTSDGILKVYAHNTRKQNEAFYVSNNTVEVFAVHIGGYINECTSYASSGTVKITKSTTLKSLPCSRDTCADSLDVYTPPKSEWNEWVVTGIYQNTAGNYWYKTSYNNQDCYLYSGDAEFVSADWGEITISGVAAPTSLKVGEGFPIKGYISSTKLPITFVGAYIYKNGSLVMKSEEQTKNDAKTFEIYRSSVDMNLKFGSLEAGTYTYQIAVTPFNYKADGNSLTKLTQKYFYLHENAFSVNSETACAHIYSSEITYQGNCEEASIRTYTCTLCGCSYTESIPPYGEHSWGGWSVLQEATCTQDGVKWQKCYGCYEEETESIPALGHNYGDWKITTEAECLTDGEMQKSCTRCGDIQSQTISAEGHSYVTTVIPATCIEHSKLLYNCADCQDSYEEYTDAEYSDWSEDKPEGVDEELIESKNEYRYSVLEETVSNQPEINGIVGTPFWQQANNDVMEYVKNWPDGYSTSHSLYTAYNKVAPVDGENETTKNVITSDEIVGYLYYHWCRDTYAEGPINRRVSSYYTGEFVSFHSYFSATAPGSLTPSPEADGSYIHSNSNCCKDSYWYFTVPVYKCEYTAYSKMYHYLQWSDWTDWGDQIMDASETVKEETRVLYRYTTSSLGDHTWVDGLCTVCGEKENVIPDGLVYEIVDGEVTITDYTGSALELSIPDTIEGFPVTAIAQCAFLTKNLTAINIPHSVTVIGDNAFAGCLMLTGIWVDPENSAYCSDSYGALLNKAQTELIKVPATLTGTYTVPVSVTNLSANAFSYCSKLTRVILPDGLAAIKDDTFYQCDSLINIIIPDSVTSIGVGAFSYCSSLESVVIPINVTNIGYGAFSTCINLISVTFQGNAPFIDADAFLSSDSVKAYYSAGNATWTEEVMQNYGGTITWIATGATNPDVFSMELSNDGTYYIVYGASSEAGTDLVVPDSYQGLPVRMIAAGAFEEQSWITSVVIPDSISVIGDGAFFGCDNLTSIVMPASLTAIGGSVFYGCASLTDIRFVGDAPEFDNYVFYDLSATVYYPAGNATWTEAVRQNYGGTITWVAYDISDFCDHQFGEWVITKAPTFNEEGQQKKTCTSCGTSVSEILPIAVGKVEEWNIILGETFKVKLHLNISSTIENTAKVKITLRDKVQTYSASQLTKTASGLYIVDVELAASQMSDDIIVMITNNGAIGSTDMYSIRRYADTILADESYSRYHDLIREMLNYGAMAQTYFDYNTESLANDGIADVGTTAVPEVAEELTVSDNLDSLNFYGASLAYRDKIAVRYYFTGDMTGCIFTANGNTYTPVTKDDMHYVEIADILPQNLDQQITLTVTDAEGNELSVTYGPMNYIVRMNEKGSNTLKALVKALYNYHLAAKAL